ncbi:MAG: HNH endonuclease [Chloroflexi bacterium]|nr:HNH endonuclease [Chloroflexota bacterium]
MQDYPDWFISLIKAITNKRPKIVAEHILEHGSITTEELENLYGYKHAPRAARDLRELGIPLETIRVKNSEGRTIAAYQFGNLSGVRSDRLAGRTVFSKSFKQQLITHYGERCSICGGKFEARYLQIDHRVPYEVAGDQTIGERNIEDYQLLCGECNRAKSWSCEHCQNWLEEKQPQICLTCYWAKPETYRHIALRDIRRVDLVWSEGEVRLYEQLRNNANQSDEALPDYVKKIITKFLDDKP